MTKKHFQLVAEALKSLREQGDHISNGRDASNYLIGYFGNAFKHENTNFDRERFEKACGFKSGE